MSRLFMFTRRVVIHIMAPTAGPVTFGVLGRLHHVRLLLMVIVDFPHMTRGGRFVVRFVLLSHFMALLAFLAQPYGYRLGARFHLWTLFAAASQGPFRKLVHRALNPRHRSDLPGW